MDLTGDGLATLRSRLGRRTLADGAPRGQGVGPAADALSDRDPAHWAADLTLVGRWQVSAPGAGAER
jgi:hypothetical protein